MMRITEGAIMLQDKINQAYIRTLFPDTYVVSGLQFMPFKIDLDKALEKAANTFGLILYPLSISIALPVFLNQLVYEKQNRII